MKNKNLKMGLGLGLIVLACSLSMCKKDVTTCRNPTETPKPKIDANGMIDKPGRVKSPEYKLSETQSYELVLAFKESTKYAARGGGGDSIALDSSQYLLESSINYDYDYPANPDMMELSEDVSSYPFNADATTRPSPGYIASSEVTVIYNEMRARFDALYAAGSHIAAIDVEAIIDDEATGQGHFEVSASVMGVSSLAFRCSTSPWNASTNYSGCSWGYISSIFTCGSASWPGSLSSVDVTFQKGLNCRDRYFNGCLNGYWFPVVNTVFKLANGVNDIYLYQSPGTSVFNYCSGNTVITQTGAAFNSKLANTRAYIPNYINMMWPGQSFVDNSALIVNQNTVSAQGTVLYWRLDYKRGVRNCRPVPHW